MVQVTPANQSLVSVTLTPTDTGGFDDDDDDPELEETDDTTGVDVDDAADDDDDDDATDGNADPDSNASLPAGPNQESISRSKSGI